MCLYVKQNVLRLPLNKFLKFKNFYLFIYLFICFLGPHPWHVEVPRLGVQSELQLPVYIHHSHSNTIWASSVTYTTAHSNARSLTQWVGPGIEPTTSWFLVRFISIAPRQGLLGQIFLTPLMSHFLHVKLMLTQPTFKEHVIKLSRTGI